MASCRGKLSVVADSLETFCRSWLHEFSLANSSPMLLSVHAPILCLLHLPPRALTEVPGFLLAVPDCPWLSLAVPGCPWLSLAVPGCPWLSLAVLVTLEFPILSFLCWVHYFQEVPPSLMPSMATRAVRPSNAPILCPLLSGLLGLILHIPYLRRLTLCLSVPC